MSNYPPGVTDMHRHFAEPADTVESFHELPDSKRNAAMQAFAECQLANQFEQVVDILEFAAGHTNLSLGLDAASLLKQWRSAQDDAVREYNADVNETGEPDEDSRRGER